MAGSSIPAERMAANSNGSTSPSHLTISVLMEKKNDDSAASSIPRTLILGGPGAGETIGVTGELVDGVSDSITRFRSSSRSAIFRSSRTDLSITKCENDILQKTELSRRSEIRSRS